MRKREKRARQVLDVKVGKEENKPLTGAVRTAQAANHVKAMFSRVVVCGAQVACC